MFTTYLDRWQLTPDGAPILTPTSRLLPVRAGGAPAMLKLVVHPDDQRAAPLMRWWNGDGAVRLLAHAEGALLMERAMGRCSLAGLALGGRDDEASRIICAVLARLHAPRSAPPPPLTPLANWFAPLVRAAAAHGILRRAAATASELLATQQDVVVLHGDIHHENVLDCGGRGWQAIDPKGLIGERHFDYANLFLNPDITTATTPGRLRRQIDVVAEAARLERGRLLAWVLAWAGLSTAFLIEDDLPTDGAIRLAELAAAAVTPRA